MAELKRPCDDCPFTRAKAAGCRDQVDPLRLIGQARGPFVIPCHSDAAYGGPGCLDGVLDGTVSQCAGAAIFRANTGWAKKMPDAMASLPADREAVFARPQELLAAMEGWPVEYAAGFLTVVTPEFLALEERSRVQPEGIVPVTEARRG